MDPEQDRLSPGLEALRAAQAAREILAAIESLPLVGTPLTEAKRRYADAAQAAIDYAVSVLKKATS